MGANAIRVVLPRGHNKVHSHVVDENANINLNVIAWHCHKRRFSNV